MKKGIKIAVWLFMAFAMAIVLAVGAYYGYGKWKVYAYKQQIREPYLRDAEAGLGGDTPLEAYKGFRRSLEEGNKEKALQYVFVSERDEYAQDLQNQETVNNYLSMPEPGELQKDSEFTCGGEIEVCKTKAEFYYEYEVRGERKEYDMGDGITGVKEPGVYKHNMVFIKNLADRWQIGSL
jgi:hypothetical protein